MNIVLLSELAFAGTHVIQYYQGVETAAIQLDSSATQNFCLQQNFKAANVVLSTSPCIVRTLVLNGETEIDIFADASNTLSSLLVDFASISSYFSFSVKSFKPSWNCYNQNFNYEIALLGNPLKISQINYLQNNQAKITGASVFTNIDLTLIQFTDIIINMTIATELFLAPHDIYACTDCEQEFIFEGTKVDFTKVLLSDIKLQYLEANSWVDLSSFIITELSVQPAKLTIMANTNLESAFTYYRMFIQFKDICGNSSFFAEELTTQFIKQYEVLFEDAEEHLYTSCGADNELSCDCEIQSVTEADNYGFTEFSQNNKIYFSFTGKQKMKILPNTQNDYLYYCSGDTEKEFAFVIVNYNGTFKNDEQTQVCTNKQFYEFEHVPADCEYVEREVKDNRLVATYYSCLDFQSELSIEYNGFSLSHTINVNTNVSNGGSFNVSLSGSGLTITGIYGLLKDNSIHCILLQNNVYKCEFSKFGTYQLYASVDTQCEQNEPYFLEDYTVSSTVYLLLENKVDWKPQEFVNYESLWHNYIYYYRFSDPLMKFIDSSCVFDYNEKIITFTSTGNCVLNLEYKDTSISYYLTISSAVALVADSIVVRYATNEFDPHIAGLKMYNNAIYSAICTFRIVENGEEEEITPSQSNFTVNNEPSQYFKAEPQLEFRVYNNYQIIEFTQAIEPGDLSVNSVYEYESLTVSEKLAFLSSYTPAAQNELSNYVIHEFINCTDNCVFNLYYEPLNAKMVDYYKLVNSNSNGMKQELVKNFLANRLTFYRLYWPVLVEFSELSTDQVFSIEEAYNLFNFAYINNFEVYKQFEISLVSQQQFALFELSELSYESNFTLQKIKVTIDEAMLQNSLACKVGIFSLNNNKTVAFSCQGDVEVEFEGTGECRAYNSGADQPFVFRSYKSNELQTCNSIVQGAVITCSCKMGAYGGAVILVNKQSKFTGWEIFGIVVGVLVGIAVIVLVIYLIMNCRKGLRARI